MTRAAIHDQRARRGLQIAIGIGLLLGVALSWFQYRALHFAWVNVIGLLVITSIGVWTLIVLAVGLRHRADEGEEDESEAAGSASG